MSAETAHQSDAYEALPGEGEIRIVRQIRVRHCCEVCAEPATRHITFLYPKARSNPASAGYGGDDISRRSDAERFACEEHFREAERGMPGLEWCGTYDLTRMPHLGLFWKDAPAGTLLTAAEGLVQALRDNGFGATSDLALPGEFDTLVDAIKSARRPY